MSTPESTLLALSDRRPAWLSQVREVQVSEVGPRLFRVVLTLHDGSTLKKWVVNGEYKDVYWGQANTNLT